MPSGKSVFVTVGTTRFDDMIRQVLSASVCNALVELGYTQLILQVGNSSVLNEQDVQQSKLTISSYTFKPSLVQDMASADLIISHAGSGSILEALRMSKVLLVVTNPTLMNNHQSELAIELHQQGYLVSTEVEQLVGGVEAIHLLQQRNGLKAFPERQPTFDYVMRQVTSMFDSELSKENHALTESSYQNQ